MEAIKDVRCNFHHTFSFVDTLARGEENVECLSLSHRDEDEIEISHRTMKGERETERERQRASEETNIKEKLK
jgi:hypothetical protein